MTKQQRNRNPGRFCLGHPKYRMAQMAVIRKHLKRAHGVDTSDMSDEEFMDMMVDIQAKFDNVIEAVHALNRSARLLTFWHDQAVRDTHWMAEGMSAANGVPHQ